MSHLGRRPSIASREPIVAFAAIRLPIAVVALAAVEALAPATYGAVRFLALFLVAAHGRLQGLRQGMWAAAGCVALLVPVAALSDGPVDGPLLALDESVFAVCAFASAWVGASFHTAKTAARLRARDFTRRLVAAEEDVRRRVAEAIHDGPLQDLTSVDMMLRAAAAATARADHARARELLDKARAITARDVEALRAELIALAPRAREGQSFEAAMRERAAAWSRCYGIAVEVDLAPVELPPDVGRTLLQIAQEAVVNAGRHAGAERVEISLAGCESGVELRVRDDGHGFGTVDPHAASAPGHIGLASMRERAALIDARLSIESSPDGSLVSLRVPLRDAEARG